jgi:hypothetical protein
MPASVFLPCTILDHRVFGLSRLLSIGTIKQVDILEGSNHSTGLEHSTQGLLRPHSLWAWRLECTSRKQSLDCGAPEEAPSTWNCLTWRWSASHRQMCSTYCIACMVLARLGRVGMTRNRSLRSEPIHIRPVENCPWMRKTAVLLATPSR